MEVIYHAACSLDGFIASPGGGVEWLDRFSGEEHGIAEFYAGVDSLLMGSRTYEFALGHPPWMAPDKKTWVFTSRELELAHPSVTLTSDEPTKVLEAMEAGGSKRAWLLGGGELAASFRAHGLISSYEVAVIPIVLGSGIRLLATGADDSPHDDLRLTSSQAFESGIVLLRYDVDRDDREAGHRS